MARKVWYGIAILGAAIPLLWYASDGYKYISDMPGPDRLLPLAFGTIIVFSLVSVLFVRQAALYTVMVTLAANVAVISASLGIQSGDASYRIGYLVGMFSSLTYWVFSAALGALLVNFTVTKTPRVGDA